MANQGDSPVNEGRRRFLTATTAVVGAVGAGFAAVPFIKSWNPSARAKLAGAPMAPAAGLDLHVRLGQNVLKGQPLFTLHAQSPGELEYALDYVIAQADIVKLQFL